MSKHNDYDEVNQCPNTMAVPVISTSMCVIIARGPEWWNHPYSEIWRNHPYKVISNNIQLAVDIMLISRSPNGFNV